MRSRHFNAAIQSIILICFIRQYSATWARMCTRVVPGELIGDAVCVGQRVGYSTVRPHGLLGYPAGYCPPHVCRLQKQLMNIHTVADVNAVQDSVWWDGMNEWMNEWTAIYLSIAAYDVRNAKKHSYFHSEADHLSLNWPGALTRLFAALEMTGSWRAYSTISDRHVSSTDRRSVAQHYVFVVLKCPR